MSLFRVAIVVALGIAMMPADKEQQERLYSTASSAAHWAYTFCDRNGTTCENASMMWATFVKKAEFAGQLAYDVAQRYAFEEPGAYAPAAYRPGAASQGTLRNEDLRPHWRGEVRRQGI
jgi:hypothetical protein